MVDSNSLSFVRALNKDMRTSSPESIYSTYVTRARAAANKEANPTANSTLNLRDSEREIRNMLAESGLTPFDAQRFENALDMKDERLNNAMLAAMRQDGADAVNDRVQTQWRENMLAKKIAQGEGNLKNSLNPNVAIPPEIKNEISNKLKEINYEESYRSGKDFGPKDSKYITEEIGIIGNASFGLSGTATLGLVGGMNGQEKGKLELSFGNGGVGAYAGIYGMQTTAPYEVLEDPNTTVLSMGYVGGNGLVAGYNKLMIAGGDGRFYDGRMIIFGQGFSLPGLKNVDIVGYGTDFKSVDLPLPSHYNK